LFKKKHCVATDLPEFVNAAQKWGLSTAFKDDGTSFEDFFDMLAPCSVKRPFATVGLLHGAVEVLEEDADACGK